MAKITNIRERVHQPLRDALIRTSGNYPSNVQDRTDLFTVAGGDQGRTNLQNGSTLPSDQSMVVLALRTFLWFRNPQLRFTDAFGDVLVNGDISALVVNNLATTSTAVGSAEDVHRLYFQASEQLLWSVGAGQKYSLNSMPSAYFPYAGGLHGRLPKNAKNNCCELVISPLRPGSIPNCTANVVIEPGSCCPPPGVVLYVRVSDSGGYNISLRNDAGVETFVHVAALPATVSLAIPAERGPDCFTVTVSDFVEVFPPPPRDPERPSTAAFEFISNCETLIHWNNGMPEASALTRLARAILIPPRQNILVSAQIVAYADNPQNPVGIQGSRNMLSLTSNLNQPDAINKIITMTLDGLLSRDVQ